MTYKYIVNNCSCHPETCQCASYKILDNDDQIFIIVDDVDKAQHIVEALNAHDPEAKETARLDFMLKKEAFLVWTLRDGSINQCQLYTQTGDEEYIVLSGEDRYFNLPREAVDAAMKIA